MLWHSFVLLFVNFDKETIYFYTVARRREARAEFQWGNARGWLPRASHPVAVPASQPLPGEQGGTAFWISSRPLSPDRPHATFLPRLKLPRRP